MSIAGVIATALRQDAPYQAEIAMGAQLIMDFQGARSGRRPYYWYRGTRYTSPEKIPGWSFSRNSEAYAEDSAGNLIKFPANAPRITDRGLLIEEARTNLLTYSQQFDNAAWAKSNATVSADATLAPDGTTTADALVETTANAQHYLTLAAPVSKAASALPYTCSLYVKAGIGGARNVKLTLSAPNGGCDVYVNPVTGAVVSGPVTYGASPPTAPSITVAALNNGWYRLVLSLTSNTDTIISVLAQVTLGTTLVYAGDGSGVYIWGAQLEQGSFATSYIPTTTAAATRPADNASVAGLAAMLGQFRTNLLAYSQQFDNAAWGKAQATITPDATTAPDGTLTADKLVEAAVTNVHQTTQAITTLAATAYTFSVNAQAAERTWTEIGGAGPLAFSAYVNLATGAVGATSNCTVAVVANGAFWRIAVTVTPGAGSETFYVRTATGNGASSYEGDGTSGIYIWGGQLETGSTATAYIPTTTAAASAGNPVTLVAWVDLPTAGTMDQSFAGISNGGLVNQWCIRRNGGGTVGANSRINNSYNPDPPGIAGKTGARVIKAASRIRSESLQNAADGQIVAAGTIVAPPGANVLSLGQAAPAGSFAALNGYIQRVGIYGDVDDTQLQRLAA